jgi:site-specific recombinase XerD
MGALRDRMAQVMELRGFAPGTRSGYVNAVVGLVRHTGRSPDQIGREEVQDYLLYLINDRGLNWSTVNVARAAIRFLYREVLSRPDVAGSIPPRKTPKRLPEVLSTAEVQRLFAVTANEKHRVLLMTAYATGLRVSELVRLKVRDIDSSRMMIRVRQGKGRKDRYTILSARLLGELRTYWRNQRPPTWLFPGTDPGRPMNRRSAGTVYRKAKKRAGINKQGGIHTLRHCFATHLLEAGVDVRTIQLLMGHRSIRSTIRYVQLTRKTFDGTPSPLDLLDSGVDKPAE